MSTVQPWALLKIRFLRLKRLPRSSHFLILAFFEIHEQERPSDRTKTRGLRHNGVIFGHFDLAAPSRILKISKCALGLEFGPSAEPNRAEQNIY